MLKSTSLAALILFGATAMVGCSKKSTTNVTPVAPAPGPTTTSSSTTTTEEAPVETDKKTTTTTTTTTPAAP
jgi:hypothetical protein